MADIKYEIEKELGSISELPKGWKKELNLISWNGIEAEYDLRDWAPDLLILIQMQKQIQLNE